MAVVDPNRLGFDTPAIIGVSVEPGLVDQVARMVVQLSEVSYLAMTLGSFDLVVEAFCRDLPHLAELVTEQIHSIPGVRSTETLMIARSRKLSYRWSPTLGLQESY